MHELMISAVVAGQLIAASMAPQVGEDAEFNPHAIRAHVEFLADDLLEGRGTGSRGHEVAALYVATEFRSAGLEPAGASGWFQPVPLVERTPNATDDGTMTIGDTRYPIGGHVLAAISGEGVQTWQGEAVYVGYGLIAPEVGHDDYRGLDVRGRAIVFHDGAPAGLTPEQFSRASQRRAEAAYARGAVGMVAILSEKAAQEQSWIEWRTDYAQPFLNWARQDGEPFRPTPLRFSAVIRPEAAARLLEGASLAPAEMSARAQRGEVLPSFPLVPQVAISAENQWRRFVSSNVIGVVAGTDAEVLGECLIITSHLDHLGRDPSVGTGDDIFNGALDNASGVAILIELARSVAASPRRRSVVFAAVTAEELGLLGSDYLAEHGVPGCDEIVGVVNLDGGVPLHPLPAAVAYGGWHSTLGEAFEAASVATGVRPETDATPSTEFFERTDHFSFARRGVPSIYLVMSGGDDEQASAAYRGRYHQPNDDLTLPFNWQGGVRFARLANDLIRRIADAPEAPRWYADSPIGQRYAPDALKAERP